MMRGEQLETLTVRVAQIPSAARVLLGTITMGVAVSWAAVPGVLIFDGSWDPRALGGFATKSPGLLILTWMWAYGILAATIGAFFLAPAHATVQCAMRILTGGRWVARLLVFSPPVVLAIVLLPDALCGLALCVPMVILGRWVLASW
ncbi:MAG: hypothetical protein U0166_24660 [Acidobacteriota bacterium]